MLLLTLLAAPLALADPYMWGVGPALSTVVYPVSFPGSLPTATPAGFTFEGARLDVAVAARGLLYLDADSRLGGRVGFGGGGGWGVRWIGADYERILTSDGRFHFLAGLGTGLGASTFTDETEDQLRATWALARLNLGAIYRNRTQAYELDLFAQYQLPLEHRYLPADGAEETLAGRGSRYGAVGLELSLYFGDFTPPRKKRRGQKRAPTR